MKIESNAFYYLFSTAAQSFAALAGILAVFVVYALEWIQKSIEWSRSDLINVIEPHAPNHPNFRIYNLNTQLVQADEIISSLKETNKGYEYKKKEDLSLVISDAEKASSTIRKQKDHREAVTSEFIVLFRQQLILIAVFLVFSFFGKGLKTCPMIGWISFFVAVGAAAWALFRIFIFVRFSLTRPKDSEAVT